MWLQLNPNAFQLSSKEIALRLYQDANETKNGLYGWSDQQICMDWQSSVGSWALVLVLAQRIPAAAE